GGRLYVVGGTNGAVLSVNEAFDPGTSQPFSGLKPNTQYAFTAKARNADGVETATVAASTYTLAVAAAPPAGTPLVASLSSASAVVQWDGSANAPGASFILQASTMSTFSPVLSSVAASTASAPISGLLPNSTVYFRVEAFNSLGGTDGSWTAIGSTRTLIEPPSSIVFDDVSSTTLVASAYAPSPAFHNLGQGQSGTDIAVGGVFQGWHGSTWTEKGTLATAREDAAFAVVAGRLFVAGGDNGPTRFSSSEMYDPVADAWSSRASMPSARNNLQAVALDGTVYVLGGNDGGTGSIKSNTAYDPLSDTWSSRADMPDGRSSFASAVLDGKLFVAGGWNGSAYIAAAASYDPAADSWTVRAPLPSAIGGERGAAADGRFYVLGGDPTGSGASSANEAYDPRTNSWSAMAPMPTARTSFAAGLLGGKIYAVGGRDAASHFLAANEEYDPLADTWTSRTPMPTARHYPFGGELGGRLYVVGGTNGAVLSVNEAFDPGTSQPFSGLKPNTQYAFTAKARNA
ncbi:MAG: hypothetical protein KGL53_13810, partial [Elusimicrobia bacterium]|nr:hypothetical protein [Elusimicrobiota bacterium]